MSNSYKFYSDTKDIMKKYVNATEGAIIYGISKSRIMVLASEAGAVYKVGNSALINTDMRSINEQCVRQLNGEVDESEIQNIMRYGRSDIDDEYFAIIKAEIRGIQSTECCVTCNSKVSGRRDDYHTAEFTEPFE